jgi:transposase
MSMSRRAGDEQGRFWVAVQDVARSPRHPFYQKLNRILAEHGFDKFVEDSCEKFYATKMGRPSVPPGVYFRMLLIGYFEGLDSEREIDWRCSDSASLKEFLGYPLTKQTPDHSTLCVTRQRLDIETHQAVFTWVLKVMADEGLVTGKTIGVDATTLEANAAMRSIVRKGSGESYKQFLDGLANASGIQTPTRDDLARLDRERKGKASNEDWEHPHDPDARMAKMKDGRTHMGHKVEHAVDMGTGAVVGATIQPADKGDTTSIYETLKTAAQNLEEVQEHREAKGQEPKTAIQEVVADKGYHSNDVVRDVAEMGARSYISEPGRGRRNWTDRADEQRAVYANRRRIRGERGQRLRAKRGEILERTFAHAYRTGGMRRTHLRGHEKILKRLLIHICGLNLSLVMRKLVGAGTPRGLAEALGSAYSSILHFLRLAEVIPAETWAPVLLSEPTFGRFRPRRTISAWRARLPSSTTFSTGC